MKKCREAKEKLRAFLISTLDECMWLGSCTAALPLGLKPLVTVRLKTKRGSKSLLGCGGENVSAGNRTEVFQFLRNKFAYWLFLAHNKVKVNIKWIKGIDLHCSTYGEANFGVYGFRFSLWIFAAELYRTHALGVDVTSLPQWDWCLNDTIP
jgi:hypothetical protein